MINIHRRVLNILTSAAFLTAGSFAQTNTIANTSMASYGPIVAPDSIAAVWGTNLASQTVPATSLPLPTSLGGVQVSVTDSKGMKLIASLFMVSPGQINYVVPATAAIGNATVTVTSGANTLQGPLLISNVAPGIFTANADGKGVPAAQILHITAGGQTTLQTPFMKGQSTFVPSPISLSPSTDSYFLVLYGSGIRRRSANPAKATIGGVSVPVSYAGTQSQYPGVDQVNIGPLPQALVGMGQVDVIVYIDGVPANTVQLSFQ